MKGWSHVQEERQARRASGLLKEELINCNPHEFLSSQVKTFYLPPFLKTLSIQSTHLSYEALAKKSTNRLLETCALSASRISSLQFKAAAESIFKAVQDNELAQLFLNFFGAAPFIILFSAKDSEIVSKINAIVNELELQAYTSAEGVETFLRKTLLEKVGNDFEWLKIYSLILLQSDRYFTRVLSTNNFLYIFEFNNYIEKNSSELNNYANYFFGNYLSQLCNFQPPEQYTKTLKLAVYDIIDLHEFANYQYMLPVTIINMLIVIVFSALVFWFRHEVEIASRHSAFLFQFFISVNITSFLVLAIGCSIGHRNKCKIYSTGKNIN
ncbi:uncharacterized protein LOC135120045 [Zophobas morio]|uniref:uncharacterized protein LOC135120045 n=1 Tax=Zophobas morio TaxID=2755281 RepID=UPI003083754E